MKTTFTFFSLLIFCSVRASGKIQPAQLIQNEFEADYMLLLNEMEKLNIELQSKSFDWGKVENQFFQSRLAYKKCQLFVEYLDHEFTKDHINGAPLPSIERKAPELRVFNPRGFQISEEVLMEQDRIKFQELIHDLTNRLEEFQGRFCRLHLSERNVFEAMREEVLRLATLGMTGFDTPSGKNTLLECQTVHESIERISIFYDDFMSDEFKLKKEKIFAIASPYFKAKNMDDFDRFGYVQDFVNPLYFLLLQIQNALFVETRDLVYSSEFPVNYNATNIFDTEFLNYRYFASYSATDKQTERAELGKLLFFDPVLSGNNERSCASCHDPAMGFSDGLAKSRAFDREGFVDRNSPGLINSVYNTRFFWDARATTPEEQVEHVFFSVKEFNTNYQEMIEKLSSSQEYRRRFAEAFPEMNRINRYGIVASLAAYLQTLRSFNSDFDRAIKGEKVAGYERIKEGFNVFAGKGACATCHFIPTFAGNVPPLYKESETEVLGVPNVDDQLLAELDADLGRYSNGRPKEKAPHFKNSFKTPTVRNVALTAPYMHNGVFQTLEDVVDFYNVGGGHGWGIQGSNTTLPADSLKLSEKEIADLIFFMESLTDTTGLTSRPAILPKMENKKLNERKIGGSY